jgi:uncharacterized protein (UPF0276 family)
VVHSIPAAAGVGLRTPHLAAFAVEPTHAALAAPWLEVHSENFLCDGGPRLAMLDAVAARYPLSCHGVGLSLGSAEGIDAAHLARLKRLFERVRPALVSEHLSWSVTEGVYLNDLLPLPYTEAALEIVCRNVATAQDFFGRRILVENPSGYLRFTDSAMEEAAFLSRLAERTGCGLLLDINNVYVSAANNNFDAARYLSEIPGAAVGEIHLAGHSVVNEGETSLLIDTHSTQVCDAVWELYAAAIARFGAKPTLIEWDLDIPPLPVLLQEVKTAQGLLDAA